MGVSPFRALSVVPCEAAVQTPHTTAAKHGLRGPGLKAVQMCGFLPAGANANVAALKAAPMAAPTVGCACPGAGRCT